MGAACGAGPRCEAPSGCWLGAAVVTRHRPAALPAGNTAAIPQYEVKYNVRSFGAKGDGVAGGWGGDGASKACKESQEGLGCR